MPFNATQIDQIGHYAINLYAKNDPVDQVNTAHPFYNWLVQHKQEEPAVGQFFSENVYITNDSNGQNYFGADQVSYNSRDPGRQTQWAWYNYHNGFGFDEDTLKAAGIIKTDDREAQASGAEQSILMNRLKVAYMSMKKGTQEDLAIEFLYDGSNSTKAVPGVGNIISLTPATGTVGGIDAVTNTYWRNNTALGIVTTTPANGLINAALKAQYRAVTRFGGSAPTRIFAGQAFIEALEAENRALMRTDVTMGINGTSYDAGIQSVSFNGIPVVWDPTFELLDAKYSPATPYTKRAYMVNSDNLTLRPVTGFWQLDRKPPRVYDRYVHYFGRTCSYRLTTNRRNGLSVLSIA